MRMIVIEDMEHLPAAASTRMPPRSERTNGPMPQTSRPRFGIMTAPSQVDYHDILRVWHEADTIPEIEHAWLFDPPMPIFGDPNGTDWLSVS
jgi:hypothetical protein